MLEAKLFAFTANLTSSKHLLLQNWPPPQSMLCNRCTEVNIVTLNRWMPVCLYHVQFIVKALQTFSFQCKCTEVLLLTMDR